MSQLVRRDLPIASPLCRRRTGSWPCFPLARFAPPTSSSQPSRVTPDWLRGLQVLRLSARLGAARPPVCTSEASRALVPSQPNTAYWQRVVFFFYLFILYLFVCGVFSFCLQPGWIRGYCASCFVADQHEMRVAYTVGSFHR